MADEKNNNSTWYVVGVIVIILIALAVWKPWQTEEPEVIEPEVTEPDVPVLPEAEIETEYEGDVEMVTSAVCADGKIGAIITNAGDKSVVLGKDMKILLRGLVIKDAGCDKTELAAKESTTCTNLNGMFAVAKGQNEILITLGPESGKATVTCE